MDINPALLTDGYKIDHRSQYPKETRTVYSNFTPRKSRIEGINEVVVFGIQYYLISTLIEIWNKEFFSKPLHKVSEEFMTEMTEYVGEQSAKHIGVKHWEALHKLGYLPLQIKALPEGSVCPIKVPTFTVKNTHPEFFWLTNFIETDMSSETWGMSTSATIARAYFKLFSKWARKTGGDLNFVPFQGHDFSYRGMFGRQAAMMSGAGHLTSFFGTDTIPAIKFLKKYYKADVKTDGIIGTSVFATEHAVMCVGTGFYVKSKNLTWEKYGEAEIEVFKRLITEVYPTGIVSIVSDTWNLWTVLTKYCVELKDEILARDGKLVIRPDSGDPVDIITGLTGKDYYTVITGDKYPEWRLRNNDTGISKKVSEAEVKGVVELLADVFGTTLNDRGYMVLNPKVGCIYGDSITLDRAEEICQRLADKRFASTNWVAGIGSFTYQYNTRDTFGYAMKATYAEADLDGKLVGIEIFKDPITDDGTKKSAKGLMMVREVLKADSLGGLHHSSLELIDQVSWEDEAKGELKTVFLNGQLVKDYSLKEIRDRLKKH